MQKAFHQQQIQSHTHRILKQKKEERERIFNYSIIQNRILLAAFLPVQTCFQMGKRTKAKQQHKLHTNRNRKKEGKESDRKNGENKKEST